ncbi:MAG: transcriptional regulator of arginine metabolism [Acidobacteriota bacterium]|jgi:transcriptional regulator of arginine metabolism|nr:transcriptional regulator of arginine metabolism [Acidobacteriota bacterium]
MMNIHANGDALRRREEILRVVRETAVHSQDELSAALRKRGVRVTQPTLSRDLRELGLVKTPNGYVTSDAVTPVATFTPRESRENRFEQLVRDFVLSAEAAVNLVVIKTPVAAAQPVASAIDATPVEDLLGTLGGDDTIFVAFRTAAAAANFARRVHQIAGLSPASRRRTRA